MTKKDAIDIIKSECYVFNPLNFDRSTMVNTALDMAVKALEQEPKTGHWITKIKSDLRGDMWPTNPKCSECGGEPYYSNTIYNYKFCPYCGAKMAENEEDEELIVNKDVYDTLTEEQKKFVDIGLSYFNNRKRGIKHENRR